MNYCADCAYMDINPNSHGKFRCEKARKSGYDFVSARMSSCYHFVDSFISKRSISERNALMAISKKNGCYLVTALTVILNLDNSYYEAFKYFKNEILIQNKYESFLTEYDEIGPYVADMLVRDPENYLFAIILLTEYLEPFKTFINQFKFDDAYNTYKKMYDFILERYNVNNKEIDVKKYYKVD